ncbi:MAG: hypothetical protein JNL52_07210 [Flavobacteriales bacterium]|nr:hypothetical protein [Flavobacteriales bacterium]
MKLFMLRALLSAVAFTGPLLSFAQLDEGLILLARTYKDNMFRNAPTRETLDAVRTMPPELNATRDFVVQTITEKNALAQKKWMTAPDETTLRHIHTVRILNLDMRKEGRMGDRAVMDSLRLHPADRNELVRNYYSMLFTAIGNKNQPFDLSKLDLRPDTYGLQSDTERGIVFLECMQLCRSVIWGYMNVVKPPNTQKALAHIKRYPKVNGAAYYRFTDLNFTDFKFVMNDSLQSYKGILVDHYLDVLLYHLMVLSDTGAKEETVRDLLLGSSMRDEQLWKYSSKRATLEQIFKKQ